MQSAKLLLLLCLLVVVDSCRYFSSGSANDAPVARVQNSYLYRSQLAGLVNPQVSTQDSMQIVNNYIDNWVRRQISLNEAEKELSGNMPDLENQLEDYRASLMLHSYEQQLLQQNPDTTINATEAENYYTQHKDNFILSGNVVKAAYVVMSNKATHQDSVKLLLKQADDNAYNALQQLCTREVFACAVPAKWFEWIDLQQQIPLEESDFNSFAKNNFFQTRDAVNTYYIGIEATGKQGNTAPFDYCKPSIEKIIAHKRNLQYLQDAKKRIYENALNKGEIEIYHPSP